MHVWRFLVEVKIWTRYMDRNPQIYRFVQYERSVHPWKTFLYVFFRSKLLCHFRQNPLTSSAVTDLSSYVLLISMFVLLKRLFHSNPDRLRARLPGWPWGRIYFRNWVSPDLCWLLNVINRTLLRLWAPGCTQYGSILEHFCIWGLYSKWAHSFRRRTSPLFIFALGTRRYPSNS